MGTLLPRDKIKAERQQTGWTRRWLCVCQQAGISLNPPPAAKRIRHHGHSQLSAGLLPFRFPGRPAAGCPFLPSSFLLSSHSAEPRLSELDCSEAAIADLTLPARCGRSPICQSSHLNGRLALSADHGSRKTSNVSLPI